MNQPATFEEQASGKGSKYIWLLKSVGRNLHWGMTAILLIGLIPAFHLARLPFHVNWANFLSGYWMGLSLQSIFAATLLYVMGFPLRKTLIPLWGHYWRQKPRFFVLAIFVALMLWEFGGKVGLIIIVDTVAFLEFFDRIEGDPAKLGRAARAIFIPAAYLFIGLVLVFCYNDLIASVEYVGRFSETYNNIDALIFGGRTVSQMAHGVMATLPPQVYSFLEYVYFGMFAQIGTGLVFTGLFRGKTRALALVGAMLAAYYLSLGVFFLWPGMSPFTTCPEHFLRFPQWLGLYQVQKVTLLKPRLLWAHKIPLIVDTDYYIAFPCMHITLPLIILWFMREWKRVAAILIAYDVVLVAAILLLEQHYFVDLLGGVVIAAVAIYMVDVCSRTQGVA